MNEVVRAYPHRELHVVVDNLNIHENEAARRWLSRHPQLRFHYTPTLLAESHRMLLQHPQQARACAQRATL